MSRSIVHLTKILPKHKVKRAFALALTWLEENNPFNYDRNNQLLMSFSRGFTSIANDGVNAERAAEIVRKM